MVSSRGRRWARLPRFFVLGEAIPRAPEGAAPSGARVIASDGRAGGQQAACRPGAGFPYPAPPATARRGRRGATRPFFSAVSPLMASSTNKALYNAAAKATDPHAAP